MKSLKQDVVYVIDYGAFEDVTLQLRRFIDQMYNSARLAARVAI